MRERLKKLTPNWMKAGYRKTRYLAITAFFLLARILPIRKNSVVICNVWGYGDNSKYVAEALLKRIKEEKSTAEISFGTNHPEQVPDGMVALKTNSLKALTALTRAKVWVDCNRKEAYISKRRGQYYIQLWHGGIALKKIEGDCAAELGENYIKQAKRDSAMTDLFVSNSTTCTEMFKRAFWADCEIMEAGSPRNDRFVEQMKPREGKQRVAIYAPTYRNVGGRGQEPEYFDFDAKEVKNALEKRFGGTWEILVRLHPMVAAQSKERYPNTTDISAKPDLYEYLYKADALFTDYSNTMFEFAMTGKPVFLCASDVKEYTNERGLYFDYDKLPYPKARDCAELCKKIECYDEHEWTDLQAEFLAAQGLKESGIAADKVAKRILDVLKKSK